MAKKKAPKSESTAVSKAETPGSLVLPDEMAALFEEQAGAGTENTTAEDIQLPMLKQVQDISPERDEEAPEYIEGAETGDFFNSVTRDLYSGDLEIIPANVRKTVVAFTPRAQGGGFLGEFESKEQALEYLDSPAELKETTELALLYREADVEDAAWRPAIMPATGTKQKPLRALMTQLLALRVPVGEDKKVQPPIYGTRFIMSSVRAKNAKGTYRNITFRFHGLVQDKELLDEAKRFGEVMGQRELRHTMAEEVYGAQEDDGDTPSF